MLIDTDVLVWYMRGNEKAKHSINNTNGFSISVVTYIELVQGLRNKEELSILRNSFKNLSATIIYINVETPIMIYLDTHVVLWLYLRRGEGLKG
jgi:PIN domain nuclease of toxin-antitoxin system